MTATSSAQKIGFIGLGIMGAPMARNLVAAGHEVVGHNRSRPAVDRLVESGGRAADSVATSVFGFAFWAAAARPHLDASDPRVAGAARAIQAERIVFVDVERS